MGQEIKYSGFIVICRLILATSEITGQLHEKYVGCFEINETIQKLEPILSDQSNLTIESCVKKCFNETRQTETERTFAAFSEGKKCTCINNTGRELPDWNCNVKCSGSAQQLCGGDATRPTQAYSLYTVCSVGFFGPNCDQICHCKRTLPCYRDAGICPSGCEEQWTGTSCNMSDIQKQYVGCYGDGRPGNLAMNVKNPSGKTGIHNRNTNSIEFCIEICSTYNYTYAGMQYGYDCNCGEDYNRYGNQTFEGKQVNCSFTCPANKNEKCGGNFSNSVYWVCPAGFYGRNCANRCHCYDEGPCRFNGSCLSSTQTLCKPGWTGSSCNTRVNDTWCSTDKDCNMNETCDTIDLIYTNISRCRCEHGFHRLSTWKFCTDVDECQLESPLTPCDANSAYCINSIGSYTCKCKDGLTQMFGKCIELNATAAAIGIIILGTFLAISLLVNALLIVFRRSCPKPGKPETGKDVGQSDFELNSKHVSDTKQVFDQYEAHYDDASNRGGQDSIYEEIIPRQKQIVVNPPKADYVNAVCSA